MEITSRHTGSRQDSDKSRREDMSTIGWIGTGVMGLPMALHLMRVGHQVTVFTRTKGKAKQLIDGGVKWVNSAQEVAQNQDFVCTMVGHPLFVTL